MGGCEIWAVFCMGFCIVKMVAPLNLLTNINQTVKYSLIVNINLKIYYICITFNLFTMIRAIFYIIKYAPVILVGILAIHCFLSVGNKNTIISETFNTPPLLCIVFLVFSYKFKMCICHKLSIVYCYIIHLIILLHEKMILEKYVCEDTVRLVSGFVGMIILNLTIIYYTHGWKTTINKHF